MSTINAQNYGDGTDSVPASAVLEGTAKALFDYDKTVPSVDASYNVSSISDNATGDFQVNFTNAFANADYQAIGNAPKISSTGSTCSIDEESRTGKTTSACDMVSYSTGDGATEQDRDNTSGAYWGTLA